MESTLRLKPLDSYTWSAELRGQLVCIVAYTSLLLDYVVCLLVRHEGGDQVHSSCLMCVISDSEDRQCVVQGPCAAWVERSCTAVLLQHFLLGFELELYQPKDFCMLYWYITPPPTHTPHTPPPTQTAFFFQLSDLVLLAFGFIINMRADARHTRLYHPSSSSRRSCSPNAFVS